MLHCYRTSRNLECARRVAEWQFTTKDVSYQAMDRFVNASTSIWNQLYFQEVGVMLNDDDEIMKCHAGVT